MLYITRHGVTYWNKLHKLQGRTDIPLCDEGRAMAAEAAYKYRNIHFDICYCSPLIRARETAEIFMKDRNIPIVADRRLAEMSFGIYEGTENSFQIPDCPINELFFHPESYKAVEGGEEISELFARTGEFLRQVIKPAMELHKDVLIVGHGAMNASIICQLCNIPIEHFWNVGVNQCELKKLI